MGAAPRSRGTSGRNCLNPLGNDNREFVKSGNILSSRTALVVHVCVCRSLRYLVEQPDGSFLPNMPRYQELWKKFVVPSQKRVHGLGLQACGANGLSTVLPFVLGFWLRLSTACSTWANLQAQALNATGSGLAQKPWLMASWKKPAT